MMVLKQYRMARVLLNEPGFVNRYREEEKANM